MDVNPDEPPVCDPLEKCFTWIKKGRPMINSDFLHPSDQLVMIMKRIYEYGMTTMSGGNLSIKDDNGDIWITPAGIDKGGLTRNDIVRVKPDGTTEGRHKPSSELPFHRLAYEKAPQLRAVLHAHPPALVAFSMARKIPDTSILASACHICGKTGMARYDLPGSVRLGEKIAAMFERGCDAVMLENHGVVAGAENIYKAFLLFETLDFCARVEISAHRIGKPIIQKDEDLERWRVWRQNASVMQEFVPVYHSNEEKAARRDICDVVKRAYRQRLFTGSQGTVSQRLGAGSFVITPAHVDRAYIAPEDLTRIDNGIREAGRTPDDLAPLHALIYETQPHVNAIITACAPNLMAFAVTGVKFDSRVIPESYILLRNMPKLQFDALFSRQEEAAKTFVKENPVALVENGCVIATGGSLINAFDRLEVGEYSAKAIIASRDVGDIATINDMQTAEIHEAFHLD
ncbi:MAG: class II aldolase/adducin family protein [Treponema sp.]|jgi:L-fuculose-phosphate aldolase|nr:class II aldolase/adducin family protein [Treponema sp.]